MLGMPRSASARTVVVTVGVARQLDDEHEPAAAIAAGVRAGQLQSLDPASASAVELGDPRAAGQHLVQVLELGHARARRRYPTAGS